MKDVIQCKDCRNRWCGIDGGYLCNLFDDRRVTPDDGCTMGERIQKPEPKPPTLSEADTIAVPMDEIGCHNFPGDFRFLEHRLVGYLYPNGEVHVVPVMYLDPHLTGYWSGSTQEGRHENTPIFPTHALYVRVKS